MGAQIVGLMERRWGLTVAAIAAAALLVRVGVIAASGGGFDLDVYVYFARLALAGRNPYEVGDVDPIGAQEAVNLPLEHLLFAGLLELRDSPDTLRYFLALCDTATVAVIGLWPGRSTAWRLALMTFFAFSPFVLYSWTGHAEDKSLLFLGITVLLILLERGRWAGAWAVTAALAAFKWIGAFWAAPLALATYRARGLRYAAVAVAAFLVVFALAHLPWLPESLDAYDHRSDRLGLAEPLHAAILKPLAEIGLYDPAMARFGTLLLLGAVYLWYLRGGLAITEAVVLSIVAAYLLLPDQSNNRILQIALPVLFVIRITPWRMLWLWAVSFVAAAALVVQLDGKLQGSLGKVFGDYGSLRHVIVMNTILVSVLIWFALDRRAYAREPRP
jgi:hypothetical protein